MKCLDCGGILKPRTGTISIYDKHIGQLTIKDADYLQCQKCGNRLYSAKTAKKIEEAKGQKREELLFSEPIGNYITASEAANILNISRQALHKHRRIRRGFIYQITYLGRMLYHKKSVELFKRKQDGRFPLVRSEEVEVKVKTYTHWECFANHIHETRQQAIYSTLLDREIVSDYLSPLLINYNKPKWGAKHAE